MVVGIGAVPSFKNTKKIVRNRKTGASFLITDPKKKKWMDQCIALFVHQLSCASLTRGGATSTDALPRFLTASLPQDDCWQNVPELHVSVEKVEKGNEGCEILIEPL